MDNYKIKKANELYSKIQGALWAKDKMLEYEHYDRAKEVSQKINQWYKEIENLKLTEEESISLHAEKRNITSDSTFDKILSAVSQARAMDCTTSDDKVE